MAYPLPFVPASLLHFLVSMVALADSALVTIIILLALKDGTQAFALGHPDGSQTFSPTLAFPITLAVSLAFPAE